jgi:cell division protein FtsB
MLIKVEQREKSIKSLGKKNANLQKINEDMASGIDELENQVY